MVHDRNMMVHDFCDRVSNEKKLRLKCNMACNSSLDNSSENVIKYIFVKKTLNKNKIPSSFQNFSSCKNAFFASYKSMKFNC